MATAFTTYTDGTVVASKSGGTHAGTPAYTVLTGYYDATKRNMTVDLDTMEVLNIPAGTVIHNVVLEVITGETTATPTINVGDGTDPNGWVAGAVTSAAGKFLGAGAYVVAGGKIYTTADTLDLEMPAGDDATTLVCKVHALCTITKVA